MDISTEIAAIQAASQGSELRQPLVGALNKLNSGSLPAVTASDVGKILKVGANGWEVGEKSGYMPVPTATKQITENGTYDVTDYANAVVYVSGGGGGSSVITGRNIPSSDIGSNYDIYCRNLPLPSNVTFVEYLESSGSQYIDTGIYANEYTDICCKSEMKGNEWVLGARVSFLDNAFMITGTSAGWIGIGKYSTASGFDETTCLTFNASVGDVVTLRTKTILPKDDNNVICVVYNGDKGNAHKRIIHTSTAFTSAFTQILFGMNNNGTKAGGKAKIYRVAYYQSDELIADYIPCLDPNNVPCMWDNVSMTYVYNNGTGNFSYGSTITPDNSESFLYIKIDGIWKLVYAGEFII